MKHWSMAIYLVFLAIQRCLLERGGLVPIYKYLTCVQACAVTCACIGSVLYSKAVGPSV